jgi:pimeloyl-ACP methyl ester carboxylesterase
MRAIVISLLTICCCSATLYSQENWKYDTINIGGIKQVIATKGVSNGPLILFLHGGPGSSRMRQADLFSNALQQQFLVVQWDQREAGKTQALNASNRPVSLELMVEDTHDLIDALLHKYHQKKLYLAGESWGTVLGFKMAELYPQLLHAYLAFSPVTDQLKSEQLLLAKLQEFAKQQKNDTASAELAKVKVPFENYEQLYYLRKWWFSYDGSALANKDTAAVKNYLRSWADTWLPTWNAAMKRNLFTQLPSVKCPVYFFLGGKDYQTNCELAKAYYNLLKAPAKKMYWFDNASHSVMVSEAAKVQEIILAEILPRTGSYNK